MLLIKITLINLLEDVNLNKKDIDMFSDLKILLINQSYYDDTYLESIKLDSINNNELSLNEIIIQAEEYNIPLKLLKEFSKKISSNLAVEYKEIKGPLFSTLYIKNNKIIVPDIQSIYKISWEVD